MSRNPGINDGLADILVQSIVAANTTALGGVSGGASYGTIRTCAIGLCTASPEYTTCEYVKESGIYTKEMLISHEVDGMPGWSSGTSVRYDRPYPSYKRALVGQITSNGYGWQINGNHPMKPRSDSPRTGAQMLTDIPYGTVTNYDSTIFFDICDEDIQHAYDHGGGRKGWPTISHFGLFNSVAANITSDYTYTNPSGNTFFDSANELQWWGQLYSSVVVLNGEAAVFKAKQFTISVATTSTVTPT